MKMKINPIIGTTLTIAIIFLMQVHTSSCTNGGSSSGDTSGNGNPSDPKGKVRLTLSYPIRVGDKLMLKCVDKDCKVTDIPLIIPEEVPANTALEVSVDTSGRQNVPAVK
jgi:hypothetical protein